MSLNSDGLLELIKQGLKVLNPSELVAQALLSREKPKSAHVVAIGKAATSMTQGALAAWSDIIQGGLVVSKNSTGGNRLPRNFSYIEAGHPIPNEQSLQAGKLLIESLTQWPEDTELLFLISGGSSALVEVLPGSLSLEDLQEINSFLLGSGWDIKEINKIRRSLSVIKGGGLLNFLADRPCTQLLLSDVPGNHLATIGSGLLVPNNDENIILKPSMPRELRLKIKQNLCQKTPQRPMPQSQVLADNAWAVDQFALKAKEKSIPVHIHDALFCNIDHAIKEISAEFNKAQPGLHLWGGEITLILPEKLGKGGRNQSLALSMAMEIKNSSALCICLATDGNDGPGNFAGAIVDGETISRGMDQGLNPFDCLLNANAGGFLQASGDLLFTGPTDTNLMDIYMLYQ